MAFIMAFRKREGKRNVCGKYIHCKKKSIKYIKKLSNGNSKIL